MLQTRFAIFYFITGDTQLLNYPPFKITLHLQLIPAFPSLTSETATILELFPASHTSFKILHLELNPLQKSFSSPPPLHSNPSCGISSLS